MSSTSPTLALCIPAFKAELYLPRLLESANQQSPPFDEIIVCVDASPDKTADVARSYGATVIVNSANLGCSASKNRALDAATSDWIHFHDADDLLLPNFTNEARKWMTMGDPPDVVIMGFEYRNFDDGTLLSTGLIDDPELSHDPIRVSIATKLPNFGIYKRSPLLRVGGFDCDPRVLYNEDVAFHTKLALAGFRFRASNVVTSINWLHPGSMSQSNVVKCLMAQMHVMTKVAEQVGARYPREVSGQLWATATGLASHKAWNAVDTCLELAMRLSIRPPTGTSQMMQALCHLVGPPSAFRIREYTIRAFKPHLRASL